MLIRLHVKNILLLENTELEFKPGLNVLTGETGAGKSILLDCLDFLLGQKSVKIDIGNYGNIGEVTGVFQLKENKKLRKILEDLGYQWSEDIIVRRQLNADKKRKAFFNDTPCSVELLKILKSFLIDLNGQFDEQGLLDTNTHLNFLDRFADSIELLNKVEKIWIEINHMKRKLEKEEKEKENIENIEFLQNSLKQIKGLNLKEGELEKLEERRKNLKEIINVRSDLSNALKEIQGEGLENSIINTMKYLERAEKKIGSSEHLPLKILEDILDKYAVAFAQLEELVSNSSQSEEELLTLENKYFSVKKLMRTHNVETEDVYDLENFIEEQLQTVLGSSERIKKIEEDIEKLKNDYDLNANALSKRRKESAKLLDKNIERELVPLKLDKTIFRTEVVPEKPGKLGVDRATFMTAINPGSPLKHLNRIASGGELSRFLLAVKLCLINDQTDKSQVFDEIDRGVGGATATAIGKRLLTLSKKGQVLVVTHSPQVAAFSNNHIKVEKFIDGDNTYTKVNTLEKEEIIEEIARMLSGEKISREAEEAAKSLILASMQIS